MASSIVRSPTSDFSVQWSRSTGSFNYATVDEYPTPVDTDYNSKQTYGMDKFGFSAVNCPSGVIDISVRVYIRVKTDPPEPGYDIVPNIVVGGTTYSGTGLVSDGWYNWSHLWATNPKSSADWTVDDVNGVGANALQYFGYSGGFGTDATMYVSQAYLVVYYDYMKAPLPLYFKP